MTSRERPERPIRSGVIAALVAAAIALAATNAMAKTKIRQAMSPTAHAPRASGVARLVLHTPTTGKFTVKARRLPGGKTFDVVVNGVKVGTLTTGPKGTGTAKFTTSGARHAATLGFDPQGAPLAIRDEDTGDDDLETDMPDDNPDSAIGCCLGSECEEETAAECTAHGGTPTGAGGCLPDPCSSNPPSSKAVCCDTMDSGASVDDDPEVECEDDTSEADCAARGGMIVEASSCDPNPCQPTPPPQLVICCVPDGGGSECEHVTPDHCTAAGGTVNPATSCDPDPCAVGDGSMP